MSRLKMSLHKPWNVLINGTSLVFSNNRVRSFISLAALFVNVMAKICRG